MMHPGPIHDLGRRREVDRWPTARCTPGRSGPAISMCGRSARMRASGSPSTSAKPAGTADFRPWIRLWAPNGISATWRRIRRHQRRDRAGHQHLRRAGRQLRALGLDAFGTYRLTVAHTAKHGDHRVGGRRRGDRPTARLTPGRFNLGDVDASGPSMPSPEIASRCTSAKSPTTTTPSVAAVVGAERN